MFLLLHVTRLMMNLESVFKHCHCPLVGIFVFTDPSLSFTVRYFLWCLPDNHEICVKYDHSFKNVTVSNLIKDLNYYGVCCGITDKTLVYSFTEHSVPKQFSLTDATCK